MKESKINALITAGCDATTEAGVAGLFYFVKALDAMEAFKAESDEAAFAHAESANGWAERIASFIGGTIEYAPNKITLSGTYKSGVIRRQQSLCERLLTLCAKNPKAVSRVHASLASLLRDPDDLSAWELHWNAAIAADLQWSEAYIQLAEEYETSSSSKVRKLAIETYERALRQETLSGGQETRVRILERLIHRCTKEWLTDKAAAYTTALHELQPLEPVSPNLHIRRCAPCPCHSGKKYKDCCGRREA